MPYISIKVEYGDEIMRPEYRVQQCVAIVLVSMSKLLQLISPVISTTTTVTKKYLSNLWVHTISGSQAPEITMALLWSEEADLCRTE